MTEQRKPQPLAKPEQVAEWLQVPADRLRKWRQADRGPSWIKLEGGAIRYAWSDVHDWARKNRTSAR